MIQHLAAALTKHVDNSSMSRLPEVGVQAADTNVLSQQVAGIQVAGRSVWSAARPRFPVLLQFHPEITQPKDASCGALFHTRYC